MQKWQHQVISTGISEVEIQDVCEKMEVDGWELASAIAVEATPGEWRTRLFFKRPKDQP